MEKRISHLSWRFLPLDTEECKFFFFIHLYTPANAGLPAILH